jgi:TPR repeat protein
MDEFLCPITHALPLDPVLAEDGKVYERSAVETWLRQDRRSPSTNLPMGDKLVAAPQIKNMIERLVKSDALPPGMVTDWKQRMREQEEAELLQSQAKAGDAAAATRLGALHRSGKKGLAKDTGKAHALFAQAAAAGNAVAMGELAGDFYIGSGTEVNPAAALRWAAAGAALGDGCSMVLLSGFYSHGSLGLPIDKKEADNLVEQACAAKGLVSSSPFLRKTAADVMRKVIAMDYPECRD